MDDTKTRILTAAIRAVRLYGLEGARVQNISELAGLSPGALYRYFDSKDQLMEECFILVDKQAAVIFDGIRLNPLTMLRDPMGAVKTLWQPYFRFWLARPDETVFYHRFRDSAAFPEFYEQRDLNYFSAFADIVRLFLRLFPKLDKIKYDMLWLHVLTTTVMYAKYVVEGYLPDNEETEETVFQFLTVGLSGYLLPEQPERKKKRAGHGNP